MAQEDDPGGSSAQAATRASILLKTDEGWTDAQLAAAFDVAERTVRRVKRRYVEEGLEEALRHHNSPASHCKLDEKVEAHLIARACSPAPEGHDHKTLRLLADKTVELGQVESLSYEMVRLHLKKHAQTVGQAAVVYSQVLRRPTRPPMVRLFGSSWAIRTTFGTGISSTRTENPETRSTRSIEACVSSSRTTGR